MKKQTSINVLTTHVPVEYVDGLILDKEKFKEWRPEYANALFIDEENGEYICSAETEKMSKSKYNTVNPNDLCDKYGADTFRMYEMFLGPVEQKQAMGYKGYRRRTSFLKKTLAFV